MNPYDWSWSPEALALLPLGVAYALGVRRHPAEPARQLAFGAGLGLIALVLVTPLDTLARGFLLTAHLLQNVVLAEWAPALLVVGLPPALAASLARSRATGLLTHPLVTLPLWLGAYFAWHLPFAYDAALRHPQWLLPLEHASYLLAGLLLWWPVVHRAMSSGARAAYVFAAFVLGSPLGLMLALVPRAIYSTYRDGPGLSWISPLADQQAAGMTMAFEQAAVFFAVFVVCFLRFLREDEAADVFRRHAV